MNDIRVNALSQNLLETVELDTQRMPAETKNSHRLAVLQHYLTRELCKADGNHVPSVAQTGETKCAAAAYRTILLLDEQIESIPYDLRDSAYTNFLTQLATRTLRLPAPVYHF